MATSIITSTGKATLLRVSDQSGRIYGGGNDFIEAEVILILDSMPANAYGFSLRNDNDLPARQGMLDLLRDAFNHNWTISIDASMEEGKTTGLIIRLWLTKG
jgi:hypothetical protein